MLDLKGLLSNIKGGKQNKIKSLTGLGIEQIGKTIYLFFKTDQDTGKNIRLAKSIDGIEFKLLKVFEEKYTRKKISPKIIRDITPRTTHFDSGQIEIEGVVKISQGSLVIYHNRDWPHGFQIGSAIIKDGNIIYRSDTPLWHSPPSWVNKKIEFIGLAHVSGKLIA